MDTTEQNINMCDCPEIQSAWEPQIGDWVLRKYSVFGEELDQKVWDKEKMIEIVVINYKSCVDNTWFAVTQNGEERIIAGDGELVKVTSIWLPRQDQLQEMVDKTDPNTWYASNGDWTCWDNVLDNWQQFKTGEQLWIAFVMKEKFNKVWDGENWVEVS